MSFMSGTLGHRRNHRSRHEASSNNTNELNDSRPPKSSAAGIRSRRGTGNSSLVSRWNVFLCLIAAGNIFFFLGRSWVGDDGFIDDRGGNLRVLGTKAAVKTSYSTQAKDDRRFEIFDENAFQLKRPTFIAEEKEKVVAVSADDINNGNPGSDTIDRCSFRRYPPNRYYNLTVPLAEQPSFLSDALYIRGELPIILNAPQNDRLGGESKIHNGHQSEPIKVCVDTSEWEDVSDTKRWPFTDGHNPSLMSLAMHPTLLGNKNEEVTSSISSRARLNPERVAPIADLYGGQSELEQMYIGLTVMGNGQCSWKMSADQIEEYKYSALKETPDKRTLIIIFDNNLRKMDQTTIVLEQDETFGKRRGAINAKPKPDGTGYERSVVELDDPRLFFHQGDVWVLFRNGPKFGYEDQLQNRLHFESITRDDGSKGFAAYIKASETIQVCCGRNMALISEEPLSQSLPDSSNEISGNQVHMWGNSDDTLKALTWVDPVTTVEVDLSKLSANAAVAAAQKLRRLTENHSNENESRRFDEDNGGFTEQYHRRLGAKKSHIHGTNGYMVPLHSTGELLGIAHFHRPEKRDTSDYALHGHHYTHTFFTIGRKQLTSDQDQGGYELKRISNEFLFRSIINPASKGQELDGDIIQFASGLDLIGSDEDGKLLISYGINDCEGAAFFLDMHVVQNMLIDIGDAKEVVDLMDSVKK